MVPIHRSFTVSVPVDFAFSYITDFAHLPEWMFGIQSIRVVNDIPSGLGARYDAIVKLGAELRSTIEVTEYQRDRRFGTESRSGFSNQASWWFRALDTEVTEVEGVTNYQLPGGIPGRIMGRTIAPFVAGAMTTSEHNLIVALESRFQANR